LPLLATNPGDATACIKTSAYGPAYTTLNDNRNVQLQMSNENNANKTNPEQCLYDHNVIMAMSLREFIRFI